MPAATGQQSLAGVCPSTIVVQTSWEPEGEHGGLYQLIGPGYTIDTAGKRVRGPLVAGGKNTGVDLELRAGGAAIGYAAIQAQMYLDRSITLGAISTDRAVDTSATQPVTAVFAPLVKSPQILMWDPASHPDWRGIADIGASRAPVVVAKDNTYTPLLIAKNLVTPGQIDASYTGAPARFVLDPTIAQQGNATSEPYLYQHEIASWRKPVRYQLLADVGYRIYPIALSVRGADLAPLSECLTRLVPIMQQAQIDYLNNPAAANHLIVDTVEAYNDGWTYTSGAAAYATTTMRQLGIVANDTSGALGGMDPARVQATIDTFRPLFDRDGGHTRPGLRAADIATNRFINPTIQLR